MLEIDTTSTPAAQGYRMPAEWEPHASTWLAWPHKRSDWPGKFSPIRWVYVEIIRALTRHEPVNLIVRGPKMLDAVRKRLAMASIDLAKVQCWELPTDRSWVRDSGPIFVVNDRGGRAVLDWRFNAWAKYDDWTKDDLVPAFVAERLALKSWQPRFEESPGGTVLPAGAAPLAPAGSTVPPKRSASHRVVLEGGSIDVNGQGLMLTTEECLLSKVQERNPPFDRADYERVFADYLGVKKVLWLNQGIAGDDTHGHVDDLARFVHAKTIVAAEEKNPADANYAPLQENLERLRGMCDLDGGKLEVVPLPMPAPLVFDGMRLPASYANFYIANGAVIVPTFNDPQDRVALGILGDLFPDREVVGIHCVDLVWGLGTLHCMTQQEPA